MHAKLRDLWTDCRTPRINCMLILLAAVILKLYLDYNRHAWTNLCYILHWIWRATQADNHTFTL